MDPRAVAGAYLLSAVTAAVVALICVRQRRAAPGAAVSLAVTSLGLTCWAGASFAMVTVLDTALEHEAALLTVLPAAAVAVAGFFCLSRALADRDWRLRPRTALLLCVHPVLLLATAVTNPLHHLLIVSVTPRPGRAWDDWTPGPLFWVHTAYCYLLLAWGFAAVVRARRNVGVLHRRQLDLLLLGAVVPVAGNAVFLFGPWRNELPDITALCFCVTAVADGWAIFGAGFTRLVPIARGLVLDRLGDAVVVIDADHRVLDVNAAGRRLVHRLAPHLPPSLAGVPASELVRGTGVPVPITDGEYETRIDGARAVLDVRTNDLVDGRRRPIGRVVVVRDVTLLHAQRAALAEVNHTLLRHVETIDRLRRDLAEQAVRDDLTGVHNRRYLAGALDAAIAQARRTGHDLSVVVLDLDHFKAVNDRYGHAVGDEVLARTARALASGIGPAGTLARYGGEEFVVLLPATTRDDAFVQAEAWRERCAAVLVESRSGPVSTTISAGVASAATAGLDAAALLQAADDALYVAKSAGRDRVVAG